MHLRYKKLCYANFFDVYFKSALQKMTTLTLLTKDLKCFALQYQALEYPAGAVSPLLISLIVHLAVSLFVLQFATHMVQAGLMVIIGQGIAYLSCPVIGHLTDFFLTRHE